jgi:hypothetical protein
MPPDPDKRQLRQLKRTLKKRGNKHRRQQLKRDLAENPDEAAYSEEQLGRYRSETLNRLDNDATRRRVESDPRQET